MKHRTNEDFRLALSRNKLSQAAFAKITMTDRQAVNRWATGRAKVHGCAWILLDLLDARPELSDVIRKLRK